MEGWKKRKKVERKIRLRDRGERKGRRRKVQEMVGFFFKCGSGGGGGKWHKTS